MAPKKIWRLVLPFGVGVAAVPLIASAHEVYVLSPDAVQNAVTMPAFSGVQVALEHVNQFIFWGCIAVLVISTVFFVSLWHRFEQHTIPIFTKLKPYAPIISRIALSLSLLAAALYGALFGPELPLYAVFGDGVLIVRLILAVIGLMLLFDFYTWVAGAVMLVLFGIEAWVYHEYLLTYTNYFGDALALILFSLAAHGFIKHRVSYAMLILRVCFGFGLIFSSFYAKILHNNLALQVASLPLAGHPHSLAYYFGFEPHFLVLGAAIIEIVIGLFFILGIEIRWTSIFMLFWLSMSLWYFGEEVWPHIILIGIALAFFCYGYDKYSLEGYLLKRLGHRTVSQN